MATQDKPASAPKPKPGSAPKPGLPETYTAPHEVFTGGTLYPPGKHFTTSEPKGREWVEVDEKARRRAERPGAVQSAEPVDLDAMDIPQLKAHAAALGVDLGEAESEPEMVKLIREHAAG